MTNEYGAKTMTPGNPNKHKARTDGNQAAIVACLRDAGATVECLHKVGGGVPDLIVGYRGVNLLMEVKRPEKASKLNPVQRLWHRAWKGHVCIVRTPKEALSWIEEIA